MSPVLEPRDLGGEAWIVGAESERGRWSLSQRGGVWVSVWLRSGVKLENESREGGQIPNLRLG